MLRDLKALLMEAKQKIPPMLATLDSLSDDLLQLGGERERAGGKEGERERERERSCLPSPQVTKVVPTAVDWATGSQSALSWRPFNRNKLAALAGRTTSPTQPQTGDTRNHHLIHPIIPTIPQLSSLHYNTTCVTIIKCVTTNYQYTGDTVTE